MINHYKIVWPFGVPPGPTGYWNNDDWVRYIMSFRPTDYKGGETDTEAWNRYKEEKRVEAFNKLLAFGGWKR